MSIKRKNFFTKLMKLVGGGMQVQSLKAYPNLKGRKQHQHRTSLSSIHSHTKPLPTIMEEDESLFV